MLQCTKMHEMHVFFLDRFKGGIVNFDDSKQLVETLYGELTPSGRQIRVWCHHCNRVHIHGAGNDEAAGIATHRVCHCIKLPSPYEIVGYFVSVKHEKPGM